MQQVNGVVEGRFAAVRSVFEGNLASGADIGAAFAATVGGQFVADIWGGWADPEKTRPWTEDTLVNVYSTTKTMTAITALMLADRGDLDFASPVARYWPEFAQAGKQDVTVAHLMSHASGLSGWREPLTKEDLYDWDKCCALLAAQAPFWEPGTAPGYHALTQGYLVGEVVRRITGASLGTVFRREIAEPLGADFHIGMGPEHDARVADLLPPPPGAAIADGDQSELTRNMSANPGVDVAATRTRAWRAAEIPAANGQGHARSVARVHAMMANGGILDGKRIMSEAGCRRALEVQVEGVDLVMGIPAKFGLGFGLAGPYMPLPNPNTIYWGGYGGSIAIIDFDAGASIAYVMNKMQGTTTGDMRGLSLASTIWSSLAAG